MTPSKTMRWPRGMLGIGLGLALVATSVGIASAAPSTPSVSVTPTVTGSSVSVAVGVNRSPKAIASCTYSLDGGPATSCGTASTLGKKGAAYTISLTGLSGGEHSITVSVNLTDGGQSSGTAAFTVAAPPHVFARAWTDVGDDDAYDPASDVLIAELVDTNRDGVVSAGDTITTNEFPLGFDGATTSFGDFLVTSHTVTSLGTVGPEVLEVFVGSSDFMWSAISGFERYLENPELTLLFDNGGLAVSCDRLLVHPSSPSEPDVSAAFDVEARCPSEEENVVNGDDSFLETMIDLST